MFSDMLGFYFMYFYFKIKLKLFRDCFPLKTLKTADSGEYLFENSNTDVLSVGGMTCHHEKTFS